MLSPISKVFNNRIFVITLLIIIVIIIVIKHTNNIISYLYSTLLFDKNSRQIVIVSITGSNYSVISGVTVEVPDMGTSQILRNKVRFIHQYVL